MKVTSQGEKVIALLHEVIAAKGYEQDTYFEMAIRDIDMLPKLEGTEHVNMALIIKFPDYRLAYQGVDLPNVLVFRQQVELFRRLLMKAPPSPEQAANVDYMLAAGELFTLAAYAQLVLENARLLAVDDEVLNYIFYFLVRDFSAGALRMVLNYQNAPSREEIYRAMLLKLEQDPQGFERLWQAWVLPLKDAYQPQA